MAALLLRTIGLALSPSALAMTQFNLNKYRATFNMIRDLGNYLLELFNRLESLNLTISLRKMG